MEIKYQLSEKLTDDEKELFAPKFMTSGAAAVDLRAMITETGNLVMVPGHGMVTINTGLRVQIPCGFVGIVAIRSSLGFKHNLTLANSIGIIDSDYRGEIKVAIRNNSEHDFSIIHSERIAQLMILPIKTPTYVPGILDDTDRGEGGFGSTGKV